MSQFASVVAASRTPTTPDLAGAGKMIPSSRTMPHPAPCTIASFPTPATAPVGWFRALIERTDDLDVLRAAALELCEAIERSQVIRPSSCAELIPMTPSHRSRPSATGPAFAAIIPIHETIR